jgi:hypothetical protein
MFYFLFYMNILNKKRFLEIRNQGGKSMNCIEVITTPVELYLKSYITRHKNLFFIFLISLTTFS